MNKIGVAIAVFGIVICLISVGLIIASLDSFASIEDSKIYDGKGGEMKIEGYSEDGWLIVTMEGYYSNGKDSVEEGRNATLRDEDCDFVKNFKLTDGEGEYFIPTCSNSDDTTDDGWIHIGVICDSEGKYGSEKKGCPDGIYTWDTNGTLINVWDGDQVGETLWEGLTRGGAGLFSCCCGIVILIIGIFLAFSLQEEDTSQYYQSNTQNSSSTTSGAKGWDEREDYIHREMKEEEEEVAEGQIEEATEEKKEEKKRSGEYEAPPPPEY